MNIPNVFTFLCPTKVYLGVNSHKKLREIIAFLGAKHLFFVTDKGVAATEMYALVEKTLRENRITFEVFTELTLNQPTKLWKKHMRHTELPKLRPCWRSAAAAQ